MTFLTSIQILIGAGGLNAMVHMISFSSLMMCDSDEQIKKTSPAKVSEVKASQDDLSVHRIATHYSILDSFLH